MALQVLLGSVMVLLTVVIAVGVIAFSERFLLQWLTRPHPNPSITLIQSLLGGTLVMVLTLTVTTWLWAFFFLSLGVFDGLEPSLYFSLVSFTTLGFGDVILPMEWRLLSGFIAANGFILFGLGTAYIIETLRLPNAESFDEPAVREEQKT